MSPQAERLTAALAGRYRIERELGAGGMATVYLAHDERHARRVALKVLRPELAAVIGADRFLNEIKTTANLQHPHILPLHDSGEVDGTVWYVMPLVEGESLRERLQRETQLPIDDALQIAREVASALDYAHRHGVIHRDIKPENILLHDGRAVVADFGIALAVSRTDGSTRLTETGMSLGTPHYMSPEQAMGDKTVDARTDVYALGAVVYEMLTGEPPFTGPSVQAIVAKVMSAPPQPISLLRPTVPAAVDDAVLHALAKLPADRFRSAAEFGAALQAGATGPVSTAAHSMARTHATTISQVASAGAARAVVPWLIALGAVAVAVFALTQRGETSDERVTAAVLPLQVRTPTDLPLNEVGSPISIAPDGSFIVYVGPDPDVAGATALWRRPLDRLEATAIPGTRGAQNPRVMPDGKSVRFLKRAANRVGNDRWEMAIEGGLPTAAPFTNGLVPVRGGQVLFLSDSGFRIAAPGTTVTPPQMGTASGVMVQAISLSPDQKWIARSVRSGQGDSVIVRSLGPSSRHAIAAGSSPMFLDNDILVFRATDGTLQVGRLANDRSHFVTQPVPVVPNVAEAGSGSAIYAVADDGTLVYAPGSSAGQSRLVWVRNGTEERIPNSEPRVYGGGALSPDGRRAAVSVGALTGAGDIWIAELSLGSMSPLTNDGFSTRPAWRNGRTISYLHDVPGAGRGEGRGGGGRGRAGRAGEARDSTTPRRPRASQRVVDAAAPGEPLRGPWPMNATVDELVWSPDSQYIAIRTRAPGTNNRDVVARRVDGDSIIPFATEGAAQERGPRFSPDGKWLLYVSDRSARDEVYAEAFPGGGKRAQISANGGQEGVWSRDGTKVFYRTPDGWMMSARVTRGAELTVGVRERLFDASPYLSNQFLTMYDISPDGRFLMFKLEAQAERTDVVIVRNWVQQVKARLNE